MPEPSQTSSPPQDVPRATLPDCTQVAAPSGPDGQAVDPVRHGEPAIVQPAPTVHVAARHDPEPSQNPVEHGLFLGTKPVAPQLMGPVGPDGQETTPVRHGMPTGVQAAPTVHRRGPHAPAPSQTSVPPQGTPAETGASIPHCSAPNGPLGHVERPEVHGIALGLQRRFSTHVGARHMPAPSHTIPPPQGVAAPCAAPRTH